MVASYGCGGVLMGDVRKNMKQITIAMLICSTMLLHSVAFAGEEKVIDQFEGLKSTKKDGVIIIDFAPAADRAKMKRDAEISGRKAKRQWAQIHADQAREKAIEAEKAIRQSAQRESLERRSYPQRDSSYNNETSAQQKERRAKKILQILEQRERDHIGGFSSSEMEMNRNVNNKVKSTISDIQEHPEDY